MVGRVNRRRHPRGHGAGSPAAACCGQAGTANGTAPRPRAAAASTACCGPPGHGQAGRGQGHERADSRDDARHAAQVIQPSRA